MKAVWTSTTPAVAAATLGDDSVKVAMKMEQIGLQIVEQVENLFQAAAVFRAPRGNAAGDCIFTCHKTHATRAAAATYFLGEVARINQQGTLVLSFDATDVTLALATLRSVVVADFNGLSWTLRYTFGVRTIL